MSAVAKLWVYFVISTVLSLFLFIAFMMFYAARYNPGYSANSLLALRAEVEAAVWQGLAPGASEMAELLEQIAAQHPGVHLELLRADGSVVYSTAGRTEPYTSGELIGVFADMPYNLWTEDRQVSIANAIDWNDAPHFLYFTFPSELAKDAQFFFYIRETRTIYELGVALLLFLLTPLAFTYIFLFHMNRRLRRLNRAMNQMDIRGPKTRLVDDSPDEIGQLTRRFNQMAARIDEQLQEIDAFQSARDTLIANLSHDLRTPLTMVMGYAETIHAAPENDQNADLQRYAGIITQRARYMARLLERLLDVSRLQHGGFDPVMKKTNLSELLRSVAAGYVLMVEDKGIEFDVEIPADDISVEIDPELIERAVRNLIDNAIEYGGTGGYLGLELASSPERTEIRVKDKGPGIRPEDRDHIFEAFHRGDRGREQYGFGLGLSIVKRVADAHQGEVYCSSVPGGGALFGLRLPRNVTARGALASDPIPS